MLWSPEQIAGWLTHTYPNDPSLHVSHETVYRSLFIQARGALKKELLEHLRRTRGMRRSRSSTQKTAMERATKVAKLQLNDYSSIRWAETTESVDQAVAHVKPRKRRLTPEDTGALHQRARAWLAAKLADPFDGPTVVVTHHAPHRGSLASHYQANWLSGAFVSELPGYFFEVPSLWIHGHIHESFDYQAGNCRVVCNPRGYLRHDRGLENTQFNPELVVEL